MTKIAVVGAGMMGTAIVFPAADNGHDIHLVGTHLDKEIITSCKEKRFHPTLKRTIPDNFTPYFHTEIAEAMKDAQIVVIGVNSRGVKWVSEAIADHLQPGQILLMITKGLSGDPESGELTILPDLLKSRLPESIRDQVEYAAVGGPSIAGELAAKRHTSVVFVSRNPDILPELQATFATDYYHVWSSTDMLGVEVAVAMKNPFALAAGIARGVLEATENESPDPAIDTMFNYAAAIFAQGLTEIAYMVEVMGGKSETVYSLPGAGDLYVTSMGGRNSRMGRLLGLGVPYQDAVEEMTGLTIEGADLIIEIMPTVEKMIDIGKLDGDALPLLRLLYRVLSGKSVMDVDFDQFFRTTPYNPPV